MLQLIVFKKLRGPFYEEFYQCVTHGSYSERWHEQTYIMMSFVIMFVLPLGVLICTYFSTVFTIASECSLPLSEPKLSFNFFAFLNQINVEITDERVFYCEFNFMKFRLVSTCVLPFLPRAQNSQKIKFYHIENIIFSMHGTCVNGGGV